MRSKNETLDMLRRFCAEEGTPRALRMDNGGEYTSKEFRDF
jgi:transposase InsO family protein